MRRLIRTIFVCLLIALMMYQPAAACHSCGGGWSRGHSYAPAYSGPSSYGCCGCGYSTVVYDSCDGCGSCGECSPGDRIDGDAADGATAESRGTNELPAPTETTA